jgi:hypothetical protein
MNKPRSPILKDLVGLQVGKLTVLSLLGIGSDGNAVWRCRCQCSETVSEIAIVRGQHLTSKRTKSCGCLRAEKARSGAIKRNTARRQNGGTEK